MRKKIYIILLRVGRGIKDNATNAMHKTDQVILMHPYEISFER